MSRFISGRAGRKPTFPSLLFDMDMVPKFTAAKSEDGNPTTSSREGRMVDEASSGTEDVQVGRVIRVRASL